MLLSARDLLLTTTHGALQTRGDLPEKLRVLWSVLDGSHFLRLMQAGGRFDRMFALEAPSGGLGLALAVCAPLALLAWLRGRPRPEGGAAARSFLLWTTLAMAPAMLALPGAVRAHHMLNLLPFVHLLVASVVVDVWRGAGTRRAGVRVGVRSGLALAMAALLAANGMLIARTSSFIERTGGRGWWSDALDRFARELDAPGTVVVSLDWGFHETVLFHTREARALQPIWRIPAALRSQGAWLHEGDASHVYLLHEPAYDLFGYGPRLLRALRVLGDEAVRIERHTDRAGEVAFVSVRIAAPHRLHFDGAFRVVLR